MVYPADLDEGDSGLGIGDASKRGQAEGGASKKKRGTLASTHTTTHHHHHHHQQHSNTNQLQLPVPAGLADNALARDNSSICHSAEEAPKSLQTKCCCHRVIIDTKLAVYLAASVGFALNLAGLIFYSVQGQFLYGIPSMVSAILYAFALFAQYRQRASLFLPFLAINAFLLFLWACLCIYLAILLILLPDWCVQLIIGYYEWEEIGQVIGTPPNMRSSEGLRSKARLFIAISLAITLAYVSIECWLWWIIFRGYKATNDQKAEEWLQNLNKNIRSISIY